LLTPIKPRCNAAAIQRRAEIDEPQMQRQRVWRQHLATTAAAAAARLVFWSVLFFALLL
jgi:hypothetical protein